MNANANLWDRLILYYKNKLKCMQHTKHTHTQDKDKNGKCVQAEESTRYYNAKTNHIECATKMLAVQITGTISRLVFLFKSWILPSDTLMTYTHIQFKPISFAFALKSCARVWCVPIWNSTPKAHGVCLCGCVCVRVCALHWMVIV